MSNVENISARPPVAVAAPELPPSPENLPINPLALEWHRPDKPVVEAIEESIKLQGILQPITIWRDEDGKWSVIDGATRITAAKAVGHRFMPANFKVFVGDLAAAVAYVEAVNGHRRHMNKEQREERALRLIPKYPRLSSRKLALMTGLSHTTITKLRKEKDGEDTTYKPLERAWENASMPAQEQFVKAFRIDLMDMLRV